MKPTARVREGAIHLLCYAASEDPRAAPLARAAFDLELSNTEYALASAARDKVREMVYLYAAELLLDGWSPGR